MAWPRPRASTFVYSHSASEWSLLQNSDQSRNGDASPRTLSSRASISDTGKCPRLSASRVGGAFQGRPDFGGVQAGGGGGVPESGYGVGFVDGAGSYQREH